MGSSGRPFIPQARVMSGSFSALYWISQKESLTRVSKSICPNSKSCYSLLKNCFLSFSPITVNSLTVSCTTPEPTALSLTHSLPHSHGLAHSVYQGTACKCKRNKEGMEERKKEKNRQGEKKTSLSSTIKYKSWLPFQGTTVGHASAPRSNYRLRS